MKIVVKSTSLLLLTIKQVKSKIKSLTINLVAFRARRKSSIFYFLILAFLLLSSSITVTLAQDRGADVLEYPTLRNILDEGNYAEAVERIEQNWENQYQEYFKENFSTRSQTADQIAKTLSRLAAQTKKKPALIYVLPRAYQLELLMLTPDRPPFRQSVPAAKREALLPVVTEFINELTNPRKINTTSYLNTAQQLYQWIVAPLELNLQLQKIDTLLFCVGSGLRTLPLPALHDGQRFLTEKYTLARIPAFKFTDSNYTDIKKSQVLAMGASDFSNFSEQQPLPAVPLELKAIAQQWPGQSFINEDFTLVNLQSQRLRQRFAIIHLATHAEFKAGLPNNSYIQFWDTPLRLDQMRELGWNNPPVELLVLSACRTALGDKDVELGFAGLAVQAGVKSALASVWYVSDAGTLALMSEFYNRLRTAPIKAEALRQAQIAMIQGKVRLENGELLSSRGGVKLPPDLAQIGTESLSHPYYWAAFSMIGSPW
ncbi:MAG TPA: CHAT domain-containing protein [Kamptonema sp.]|nr:CHAT domain-containing protein [Kamptonema sp.]